MDGARDLLNGKLKGSTIFWRERVGKSVFLNIYEDVVALFIVFDMFDHVSLKNYITIHFLFLDFISTAISDNCTVLLISFHSVTIHLGQKNKMQVT